MEQPNYILKTVETTWRREKTNEKMKMLDKITIGIVVVLILGSWFFGENLFSELSLGATALLFSLVVKVRFGQTKEVMTPSEVEVWFYDDYLIIYRPKRYYDRFVTRREYNKMYYKDMKRCYYKTQMQILYFTGDVHFEMYNYNKDGQLPETPTKKYLAEGTMQYMSTRLMPDVYEVIKEIEEHSPLRVEVLENQ